MEIGDIRGLLTAVLLLAFIGVVAWSWSRKRRPDFEEVARLPLEEDRGPPAVNQNKGQGA